ncbi:MAG: hypothetical protein JNJ73_12645 [Hyphomonadaceae bacterium]|nr:hypothetical protein [Hyphomonadaceae bacterium]
MIDIGSNSVRLVIYRIDGRAMIPALNEKVMPALGRELMTTGSLPQDGASDAIGALKRFAAIIAAREIERVDVVATAAVRAARDGDAFVARVRAETGFEVRIIPGEEEARLSALGVLAGAPDAHGIVGDLGGASLELIEIRAKGPGRGESFPLGPFALLHASYDRERVVPRIDAVLARADMLPNVGGDFYAVGGAWRALARIHMGIHDYPLPTLHHLEMRRREVLDTAALVQQMSRRQLEKMDEAAARRADSMPFAAAVLERVMLRGGFDRVIISSYGLREGVLYEQIPASTRALHPLIASAEAFGERGFGGRAFGRALGAWIEPLFAERSEVFGRTRDPLLRGAASRLADISGMLHPDQRKDLSFELALLAPIVGLSHPERAFLAASVHHRYTKREPMHPSFKRLLNEEARQGAFALGAALRLGADVSARSEALLAKFRIEMRDGTLALAPAPDATGLVSDQARKRLETLGAALGAPIRVID